MKTKKITLVLVAVLLLGTLASGATAQARQRETISMWFWGAPPEHQVTMNEVLVEPYNASQDEYELVIEFRNTVDNDIAVALAAGEGPDIVYGSGPSFVAPYAAAGKLASMDPYSEQYGWQDRILAPIYESGTVNGELYALPNSLNTLGIFYNKAVLEEYGWEPPTTIEDLEAIMDAAMEEGLYASVTGNKGWRPVNENYTSLFLTHMAGPEAVYEALTGARPWNSPEIAAAVEKSAEWYQKGYLAGEDYINLNFNDAVQLLAAHESPFFIGPTLVFQFATQFFNEESGNVDELGFIPFPSIGDLPYPLYTLGTTASLSINGSSEHKDAAAAIIDRMMTQDFLVQMTERWPGYWGVPVKELDVNPDDFQGLSREYLIAIQDMITAVNEGHFGYFSATFFPPATQQEFINVDTVWLDTASVDEFLTRVDEVFAEELEKQMVPPIPVPGE
ncbi:ABC transporter substrate-binding protein [Aggregatilinea lenta]|uniref:ABC transporter substrate-binding protein n=1 Tax=Aggregatilinea lenta TaxID=913108 RepID=UPI000E5BFAF5|nr:extracellular solute-binding protein [Aggregatilinea lenta]